MNKDDRDKQLYKENKLPQTNEKKNNFLLFIGLMMASLLGVSVIRVLKIVK
ncbi:LPXTG cell wall anchor domain-containing protein [Levilactobacillus brevis]|uniref:LPXTG cell wall anchor domain-containing protein n=1 Tax=Levilactobacillus brevis TaxID=1580 RepID=A0AA41ES51_LEVBR|nr:LPXTG cell wall anchor domain-containing protein [Levilactobacillus brevis]MBS0948740.1 LPXTG cell wall anchor domain-containing protein [Levilactobacillus brevis]MBS1011893.1 LPXTG cell wall anchor domain-containing protein [Levilactobacillus brevis]